MFKPAAPEKDLCWTVRAEGVEESNDNVLCNKA